MDREIIIKQFRKYGFEYRKIFSNHDYLAFTFRSGFFNNAEIVSLEVNDKERVEKEMEKSISELNKLGFSVKKSFYNSLNEIKNSLFNGFFHVEEWKDRIRSDYEKHTKKILSILPNTEDLEYNYINVNYYKNNKYTDGNIIIDICDDLSRKGPLLTIIEAPAGFGKTCTSFEIINHLVNNKDSKSIPFFTEFSRDRQAKVFSHIFVREVDQSFSSVKSDVVIEEVKEGKITVVLDGFDELLHDKSVEANAEEYFETTEPMLETISELLTENAKVILTSRRSAIFDGEQFNEWLLRYEGRFSINRYKLEKPRISDWLSREKQEHLKNIGININRLANPVLLGYLRYLDNNSFNELCKSPSDIINHYIDSMLEREMDRQELLMNPEKQSILLRIIAEDMCNRNYTADSKEKIINLIKDKGQHLLNEVRSNYSPKNKPTIDKLATTLSNHAFLDRSDKWDNRIQFVNEFVFGHYIASNIVEIGQEWIASDERFVEPAVMAYTVRNKGDRIKLWSDLHTMKEFLDLSTRMKYEALLTGIVSDKCYDSANISSVNFRECTFFNNTITYNCVFSECKFSNVNFEMNNLCNITFLNCCFYDCSLMSENNQGYDVSFYNCEDNNNLISKIEEENSRIDTSETDEQASIRHYIFSQMWPVGSLSIERLHFFTANLFKTSEFSRKEITKEIRRLRQDGYLTIANDSNFIAINKEKFGEIKTLLGRG